MQAVGYWYNSGMKTYIAIVVGLLFNLSSLAEEPKPSESPQAETQELVVEQKYRHEVTASSGAGIALFDGGHAISVQAGYAFFPVDFVGFRASFRLSNSDSKGEPAYTSTQPAVGFAFNLSKNHDIAKCVTFGGNLGPIFVNLGSRSKTFFFYNFDLGGRVPLAEHVSYSPILQVEKVSDNDAVVSIIPFRFSLLF